MTSEPPLGQRQPRRGTTNNWPHLKWSVSPHVSEIPFPGRKTKNSVGSLAHDVPSLRHGASGLKLEVSEDAESPGARTSFKPLQEDVSTPILPGSTRGKPRQHHILPIVSDSSHAAVEESSNKPMPLPPRPLQHSSPSQSGASALPSTSATTKVVKRGTRPRPQMLEVPSTAPRLTPNAYVDFFPWLGSHQEDQFSESVIRQGFYDKTRLTQNETGSAKSLLLPALKHRGGLKSLSSCLTSVLTQKRACGRITSTSLFKPPPRVTVNDARREAWLKDLAKTTASLRKLSRNIPFGIRGRTLLEQSLSKNIPLDRALWLAKCVGANELRSFRRKGSSGTFSAGGEARWIRDFTVSVEQFLVGVVGTCGKDNFKMKLEYAVHLTANLYGDNLLDREHFMDWLVSSLETCTQPILPLWLLITRSYWNDLLTYRRFGKRLATTLMSHSAEIRNDQDSGILTPLSSQLDQALSQLMLSTPESFVAPEPWSRYKDVLKPRLEAIDGMMSEVISDIDYRNTRLASYHKKSVRSPCQSLICLLDDALMYAIPHDLSDSCWRLHDNKAMLINTVLEWSTSCYRPANTKVYIGLRILRAWTTSIDNLTGYCLAFLDSKTCSIGRDKSATYSLIWELTKGQQFSVSTYVRWLVARGGLRSSEDAVPEGPCATRLLAELPAHLFTNETTILRTSLLSRAQYSVHDEELRTYCCIQTIDRLLSDSCTISSSKLTTPPSDLSEEFLIRIGTLTRASKVVVGLWLKKKVRSTIAWQKSSKANDSASSPKRCLKTLITSFEFNIIRQILEVTADYFALADILKIVSCSNDTDLLASCADTLSLHLKTFAATGSSDAIFELLLARLADIDEDHDDTLKVFLLSLLDLSKDITGNNSVVSQQISQELTRCETNSCVGVRSPVSDHHMALDTGNVEFVEEIEAILSTGTNIDEVLMARLFRRITTHSESSWGKSFAQKRHCDMLLTRLKDFNRQHFDLLMAAWLHGLLSKDNRPDMTKLFSLLLCYGCIAFSDIISIFVAFQEKASCEGRNIPHVTREMFDLLLRSEKLEAGLTVEEAYRFTVKRARAIRDHHRDVLIVLRSTVESMVSCKGLAGTGFVTTSSALRALQIIALQNADLVCQELLVPLAKVENLGLVADEIADRLLRPWIDTTSQAKLPLDVVPELASDFTLPYCQTKLSCIISSSEHSESVKTDEPDLFNILGKIIELAVASRNKAWISVIPLLNSTVANHVCCLAESRFLALFPKEFPLITRNPESLLPHAEAGTLLSVIDTASCKVPSGSGILYHDLAEVIDTINKFRRLLCADHSTDSEIAVITGWLPLLLDFLAIRAVATTSGKAAQERASVLLALVALYMEMCALKGAEGAIGDIAERTFDLALQVVDTLPEEHRQFCIRHVRERVSDRRIRYIFSYAADPSAWLMLRTKVNTPIESGHNTAPSVPNGKEKAPVGRGSKTAISTNNVKRTAPIKRSHNTARGATNGKAKAPAESDHNTARNATNGNDETPAEQFYNTARSTTNDKDKAPAVRVRSADRSPTNGESQKMTAFNIKPWEMLSEACPTIGDNDTSLSLTLFDAHTGYDIGQP